MRGEIGSSGKAGARPVRDLSGIDVPFLHLLEYARGASSSSKSWGNYLFPNLKDAPEATHYGVTDEDIL